MLRGNLQRDAVFHMHIAYELTVDKLQEVVI